MKPHIEIINIGVVVIKKGDLNMTEQHKYEIIKKLVEIDGNKKTSYFKARLYSKTY